MPRIFAPRLNREVLLHGHCHHKALMKMTDEESVLKKMGATITAPDAGCCGMAGPFGFDAEKYDVSMAIGERVLLPAVRTAARACAHRLGRLQLPRADPSRHRTPPAAPRRSDADGDGLEFAFTWRPQNIGESVR